MRKEMLIDGSARLLLCAVLIAGYVVGVNAFTGARAQEAQGKKGEAPKRYELTADQSKQWEAANAALTAIGKEFESAGAEILAAGVTCEQSQRVHAQIKDLFRRQQIVQLERGNLFLTLRGEHNCKDCLIAPDGKALVRAAEQAASAGSPAK